MKKLLITMICLGFIFISCAGTQTKKAEKKKIYTACNIWIHKYMRCINYKTGEFIPAGTEVSDVQILRDDFHHHEYIRFKTTISKKKYKMGFNPMWHRSKSVRDYKKYLFTEKTFAELVKGMTETEIEAIKNGKIVVGMSKNAVLISYGRPAEHRTPNLKSNEWRYWMNKRKQKTICFHKGLTLRCGHLKKLSDEL